MRPALADALEERTGSARSCLARDVFSVMHFPMLCGVIALAAATKEALAHPESVLAWNARVALAGGAMLFVCGAAAAVWRATGVVLVWRVVLIALAAAAVVMIAAVPWIAIGVLVATLVAISAIEHRAS